MNVNQLENALRERHKANLKSQLAALKQTNARHYRAWKQANRTQKHYAQH